MERTATQALIDIQIDQSTLSGRDEIQWLSVDYHYTPTSLGPDQPQLVGVTVINDHDGQLPTTLEFGNTQAFEFASETLEDLKAHCTSLERVDLDRVTIPTGYTITLDNTFRLEPWRQRPWFALRAGPFACLHYDPAPLVSFHVLLCDVPLHQLPLNLLPEKSRQMFDLDFVAWLAFQD